MKIEIPDHLANTFINFLEYASYAISKSDCDELEKETLEFVNDIVGRHEE